MSPYTVPSPAELHLLLILSDSALPTGGFIASSGLESFAKHGFLHLPSSSSSASPLTTSSSRSSSNTEAIVDFARAEVEHYASTTSSFVITSLECVQSVLPGSEIGKGKGKERVIETLVEIDEYQEATMLSHVMRRSSKAQGVALLTLYSRGLTRPPDSETSFRHDSTDEPEEDGLEYDGGIEERAREIVEGYKRLIRAGKAKGHLSICWGVMTAALGLSLGQSSLLLSALPRSTSLSCSKTPHSPS